MRDRKYFVEADRLVSRQERNAENVVHRHDRVGEAAFLPGFGSPLVTPDGVGIGVIAADAEFGCDEVGADALRHEIGRHRHGGIDRPCAAIGRHRHAAHGFDAATNDHGRLARHDLGRRHVDGFEARRAEPVDLDSGHALVVTGHHDGCARDIRALFSNGRDTTQNHIFELASIEALVAVADRFQHLRREPNGRDLVQRAVPFAFAARRSHVIENIGVWHGFSLCHGRA